MKTICKNNPVSVQDRDSGDVSKPLDQGDIVEQMALDIGAFCKAVTESLSLASSEKESAIRLKSALSFLPLCLIQGLFELNGTRDEAIIRGLVQKVGIAIYGDHFFKEDVPGTLEYFLCFFEKNYRLCCEEESRSSMVKGRDFVVPRAEVLKVLIGWLTDVPALSDLELALEGAVTTWWKEMDMATRIKRFVGLATL